MNGRKATDNKYEKKIEKLLEGRDEILNKFSRSFIDKTASTKYQYIKLVCSFIDEVGNNFNNMTPDDIYTWIDNMRGRNLSEASIHQRFLAVKFFFKFLKRNRLIEWNIMEEVDAPKVHKEWNVVSLTAEEINILFNNIINADKISNHPDWQVYRDLAIFSVMLVTGLRVNELVGINLEDIDFDRGTIRVTQKGNRVRDVFLEDKSLKAIQNWMAWRGKALKNAKDENALFVSCRQNRMDTNTIRALVKNYTVGIDKHITPHKFRSTCAMNIYNATEDIYAAASQLGHRGVNVIQHYVKADDEKRRMFSDINGAFLPV